MRSDDESAPPSPLCSDDGGGACTQHARCDAIAQAAVAWRLTDGPGVLRSTAASVADADIALRMWLTATARTLLGRANDEQSAARHPTAIGLLDELLLGPIRGALPAASSDADRAADAHAIQDPYGGVPEPELRDSCCDVAVFALLSAVGTCWASPETQAAAAMLALCAMRAAVPFPCADPHDPATAFADAAARRRVHTFADDLLRHACCVTRTAAGTPPVAASVHKHYHTHFARLASEACAASLSCAAGDGDSARRDPTTTGTVRCHLARARLRISAARTGGAVQHGPDERVAECGGDRQPAHTSPLSTSDERSIGLDAAGVHAVFRLAGGAASDAALERRRVEHCRISERPVVVLAAPRSEHATYASSLRERRRFCHIGAPVSDVPPHSYAVERIALSRLAAADITTVAPAATTAPDGGHQAPRRDCQRWSRALSSANLRPSMARPTSAGADRAYRVERTAASFASEGVVPASGLREILERRPSGADLLAPPERVVVAQRGASTAAHHRRPAAMRPASAGARTGSLATSSVPAPSAASVAKRFCPTRREAASTAAQQSSFRPFVSQSVPRVMQLRNASSRLQRWRPTASMAATSFGPERRL